MIKIVIDAFGGDNAPSEIVKGAILAVNKNDDVHIVLAGDEEKILPLLETETYNKEQISCFHISNKIYVFVFFK